MNRIGNKKVEDVGFWRRELNAAEAAFSAASDAHRFGRPVVDLAQLRLESARRKLAAAEDLLNRSAAVGRPFEYH